MPKQAKVRSTPHAAPPKVEEQEEADSVPQTEVDKLKKDTDALLDEIDDVLGSTAKCEKFVESYVQKGGQ